MAEQRGILKLETNTPIRLRIHFATPSEGENQYGQFHRYSVEDLATGDESSWFTTPKQQEILDSLPLEAGSVLDLCKRQVITQSGDTRTYTTIEFDGQTYATMKNVYPDAETRGEQAEPAPEPEAKPAPEPEAAPEAQPVPSDSVAAEEASRFAKLGDLYRACLVTARDSQLGLLPAEFHSADALAAGAATLFIQACRSGIKPPPAQEIVEAEFIEAADEKPTNRLAEVREVSPHQQIMEHARTVGLIKTDVYRIAKDIFGPRKINDLDEAQFAQLLGKVNAIGSTNESDNGAFTSDVVEELPF